MKHQKLQRRIAAKGSSYALAVTAVVLAILIAVNILASVLPTALTKLDISSTKLYSITSSTKVVVNTLTDVSYDALRHQKVFTADFDTVTSIDVTLEGENYTFICTPPEDADDTDTEGTWTYQGVEFDIFDFSYALRVLSATSFTDEAPTGQEEISLTLHLDNEDFPTFTLTLYRLDGESCIACVDGESVAFVSRDKAVDLIEAVRAVTLGA